MIEVPALCPGGTVLCIASGPSLTAADVELCRGRVDAIVAVNTSFRMVDPLLAPYLVLYAADFHWWDDYPDARAFPGLKFTIDSQKTPKWRAKYPDVQVLKNTGEKGLELDPTGLRTGFNSGMQAIGVAVHLLGRQPGRVILLGYNLKLGPKGKTHWHGNHPRHRVSNYLSWLPYFQTLVRPLRELGIDVINCTPDSALKCFPTASIQDALAVRTELAS